MSHVNSDLNMRFFEVVATAPIARAGSPSCGPSRGGPTLHLLAPCKMGYPWSKIVKFKIGVEIFEHA